MCQSIRSVFRVLGIYNFALDVHFQHFNGAISWIMPSSFSLVLTDFFRNILLFFFYFSPSPVLVFMNLHSDQQDQLAQWKMNGNRRKARNPTVFYMIRWVTGLIGQKIHQPSSVWTSKFPCALNTTVIETIQITNTMTYSCFIEVFVKINSVDGWQH